MPDGSEECGIIIARLTTLEASVRELDAKVSALVRNEDERQAEARGAEAAYATIGKKVTIIFAIIGAAWAGFHWLVAEGGRDLIKGWFNS